MTNDSEIHKKSLGQYFTNPLLADLLVEISDVDKGARAIDPMCGSGNMLEALIRHGFKAEQLTGIEIDPYYAGMEHPYTVICSNAFNPEIYSALSPPFDLVITNPPYVRYQDIEKQQAEGVGNYDTSTIKRNLKTIITELPNLSSSEKDALRSLVDSYSGLSNLAIPCWILCMAITSQKGTLSLVVPETWLSREYSRTLKNTIKRMFDIQFLVVDDNPSWFDDAEAKTNLIVLKRKPLDEKSDHELCRLDISINSVDDESLIGGITIDGITGKAAISRIVSGVHPSEVKGIGIQYLDQGTFLDTGLIGCEKLVPDNETFCSFDDIGVHIGQGLRTGANKFFHVKEVSEEGPTSVVVNSFDGMELHVPTRYLLPLIKHVSESSISLSINGNTTGDRLLYITDEIQPGSELYDFIKKVESTPVLIKGRLALIPTLSAVRVNERGGRKWYMLPPLKPRHTPSLFLPRILDKQLTCYKNDSDTVVDANFTTVWIDPDSKWDVFSVFALLNSSWAKLCAEVNGTRFSAGALKYEAVQLRRMPIPILRSDEISTLSRLGRLLEMGDKTASDSIDWIVFSHLSTEEDLEETITGSKKRAENLYNLRKRR